MPASAHEHTLAIMLQRAKTFMEVHGIQERHWAPYVQLSEAIYTFERLTGLSAPALRDEEDEARLKQP